MLNRLRRHQTLVLAATLLIVVSTVSVGLAAGSAAWAAAAFVISAAVSVMVGLLHRDIQRGNQTHRRLIADVDGLKDTVDAAASITSTQLVANDRRVADLAADLHKVTPIIERINVPLTDGIAVKRDIARLREAVYTAGRRDTAQIEAYLYLRDQAIPPVALPASRGWAASADYLALLTDRVRQEAPTLMLDIGSGLTTVWSALTIRAHNLDTRIVAIDHDEQYATATRAYLERCGLSDIAEVRYAPLVPDAASPADSNWYTSAAYADLHGIGLVSIDGPPMATGPLARQPALPRLIDRLAPRCIVLLDDADRDDEIAAVEQWVTTFPEFTATRHFLEKGASELVRG